MTLRRVSVIGMEADPWSLAPTLQATLLLEGDLDRTVHALILQCQIRVEPGRRGYSDDEAGRLTDLFGDRSRWTETVRPFWLATVPLTVPAFSGAFETTLPIPVSYDLEVAAGKYFAALDDGEIPLLLLFSGTAFTVEDGRMRVEPVAWDIEAQWRLPLSVWRAVIDLHFPGQGWLRVRRDTLQALGKFRAARACTSWDETFAELIAAAEVTS